MLSKQSWLSGALTILLALPSVTAVPADRVAHLPRADSSATTDVFAVEFTNAAEASAAYSDAGIESKSPDPTTTTHIINTAPPSPSDLATVPPAPLDSAVAAARAAYVGPAVLPKGTNSSDAALSQQETNGDSAWGTLQAPTFAEFINGSGDPMQAGTPWGDRSARTSNYYDLNYVPNTGRTRHYTFVVDEKNIAPDGVPKPAIVINGQFPGPMIEANWGDWIEVRVINRLSEGTALHWHGFLQKDTPYYDGVPSVMQCPIAPGSSFTYRFRADLYGSSWYHSHYSGQYAGGALGPMIIHGPNNARYDHDLGPVMLQDWYHADYRDLVKQVMEPAKTNKGPPLSDNVLINGKMNYPCSAKEGTKCKPNAGLSKFKFRAGKKHRLRIINSSADGTYKFSIDNHNLTVIANDFVQIEPYTTNVVTLGVGQRADIIVEATGRPTDAVWMRADIICSPTINPTPKAVAVVYYNRANTSALPTTTSSVTPDQLAECQNDALELTTPFFKYTPDPNPPVTQDINIAFQTNSTGFSLWTMNNQTFRGDFNDPVLLEAKLGKTRFDPERNVYNFGSNSSIRLVLYNYFQFGPHPMHMHGHNVFVLAEGYGKWDGHVVRPENPQRRDTQIVRAARAKSGGQPGEVEPAYIVLQIEADNPGVWPLHCHIAWHVSGGLYVNILERPREIREREIPMVMAQTCRDWWRWTRHNVVDQIDSGL
ncbi:Iron transport multicopper oxidase [Sphaceloma murrayae]|uniref:Iron transport multicopper oxidase n=1 Tax=Sphaceloma murrayae TaxID=2082308 RepID=A0A2K1QK68_9PEZI|nr:Iron transport multicopper oxidase [Sphaceloma murrayae]